jgi:hypothetical protein
MAFVFRPDDKPVTWSGVPVPSDCRVVPVAYWLELVADVLGLRGDVDMVV